MHKNPIAKTLVKQDTEVLYHPGFNTYGLLQLFRLDYENTLSFSIIKEVLPQKVNTFQKILIGYKQFHNAFTLWKNGETSNYSIFWSLL